MTVLSAGDDLQREDRLRWQRGFRHRGMRHFRRNELVPTTLEVPSLASRVQPPTTELALEHGSGPPHDVTPLLGPAVAAEALAAVAGAAET